MTGVQTCALPIYSELLHATEMAAKRTKLNRSALIREALRAHLKNLEVRDLELRDRKGYKAKPDDSDASGWEAEAIWPAE